jgi:Tfp pilus assembly protein PilN
LDILTIQAELESTNKALVEENKQLRTEIQLLRDHLLNPDIDVTNLPRPININTNTKLDTDISSETEMEEDTTAAKQIKVQMKVVQNVRDQLENALNSLKALGGGEQVSHLHSIISKKLSVDFTFACSEE